MKPHFVTIILLISTYTLSAAQTARTTYCRDIGCFTEVDQTKAKFSKTVTEENGIVTTTIIVLKKNEIAYRESRKGDEPVGQWVISTGRGSAPLDYDFEVIYADPSCPIVGDEVNPWYEDDNASNYKAPLTEGRKSLMEYVRGNLRYPARARRMGISRIVDLELSITEDGRIEDLVVIKGVDIELDKEAMRLLRDLRFSSPPMRNGKPERICVKFPLRFLLV